MTQNKVHIIGNAFGLLILCALLLLAFVDQILRDDFPCPLCLLQRSAFAAIGLCACMNLKKGIQTIHYGFMILSALLGFAVALRQVFLHLTPGDPGYGPLILGWHLYTWSALAFLGVVGLVAIGLFLEDGFSLKPHPLTRPLQILIIVFLTLILANGISTLLECGFLACPENPKDYQLLERM